MIPMTFHMAVQIDMLKMRWMKKSNLWMWNIIWKMFFLLLIDPSSVANPRCGMLLERCCEDCAFQIVSLQNLLSELRNVNFFTQSNPFNKYWKLYHMGLFWRNCVFYHNLCSNPSIFFHRYICHICDVSRLCLLCTEFHQKDLYRIL